MPEEQREQPRWPSLFNRPTLWALLGSLALASIYARAALLHLTDGLVGGANDGYQNLWNNYWVKTALFDLHRTPFYTNYIYYPTGVSLRFHTLNPLNGLLTMPFNLTIGYVPTINLLFVVALFLNTFFSFLLFRYIVGNPWAAFAGAAVSTFANFRLHDFLYYGQTQMISGEWLPLYLLLMFRAVHTAPALTTAEPTASALPQRLAGALRWLPYAVTAIAMLVFMSLTDWQYVTYAVFATLLYFIFLLFTGLTWREKGSIFVRLAVIGGGYALLVAPTLLLPMIQEAASSPWLSIGYQSSLHAVDLLDFVMPGLYNPGYLTMALALFGLWAAWRRKGHDREMASFWGLSAIVFYVITLGPRLIVGNNVTGIPMPYALLQDLPLFNVGRDPGRFIIVALLGVGALVAFGLRAILQWLASPVPRGKSLGKLVGSLPGRAWYRAAPAGVVALFLIMSLSGFMASTSDVTAVAPDWPPFYEQLSRDTDSYAILELPLFSDAGQGYNHYMMYQSIHHKYRFSGSWARDRKLTNPNNFVKKSSLFRDLWMVNFPQEQADEAYPPRDILQRTDYRTQGLPILNY